MILEHRHARLALGDVCEQVPEFPLRQFQDDVAYKLLAPVIDGLPLVRLRGSCTDWDF